MVAKCVSLIGSIMMLVGALSGNRDMFMAGSLLLLIGGLWGLGLQISNRETNSWWD